jgi:hypothetical protein
LQGLRRGLNPVKPPAILGMFDRSPFIRIRHMLAHMPRIFLGVASVGIAVLITALILTALRL